MKRPTSDSSFTGQRLPVPHPHDFGGPCAKPRLLTAFISPPSACENMQHFGFAYGPRLIDNPKPFPCCERAGHRVQETPLSRTAAPNAGPAGRLMRVPDPPALPGSRGSAARRLDLNGARGRCGGREPGTEAEQAPQARPAGLCGRRRLAAALTAPWHEVRGSSGSL